MNVNDSEKIVALLTGDNRMAGVTVSPGWPGDNVPSAQLVWITEIDGETSIPVMVGGRKQRNDDFTIPVEIRVAGYGTLDDTMTRVSEIVAVIEDTLANDTSLGSLDGVLSAEIISERMTSAMFPEGPIGFAEVIVAVSARLL